MSFFILIKYLPSKPVDNYKRNYYLTLVYIYYFTSIFIINVRISTF